VENWTFEKALLTLEQPSNNLLAGSRLWRGRRGRRGFFER